MPLSRYSIETPDGWTFDFDETHWIVDPGIMDGFALPPVQHQASQLFGIPGRQLDAVNIQPRNVTITAKLQGDCLSDLHTVRHQLLKAMRWNRTLSDAPEPFKLWYRVDGKGTYLNCYYLDAPVDDQGVDETVQRVGIKLVAYDPMWYAEDSSESALNVQNRFTMSYIIGKINGLWNAMGNAGTGSVEAMAFSPSGNILYVGGTFVAWNGDGSSNYIAQYNLSTGVWSPVGSGMNNSVYALCVAPDGTLYAGGSFTTAGGGAASKIAKWNGSAWSAVGAGLDDIVYALVIDSTGSLYAGGGFANVAGGGIAVSKIAKWNGTAWSALGTGLTGAVGGTLNCRGLLVGPDNSIYVTGYFTTANGVTCNSIARWNGTTFAALGSGLNNGGYVVASSPSGLIYIGGVFTTAGGVASPYIAAWNGSSYKSLNSGMDLGVRSIVFDSEGLMYVAGDFSVAGGVSADRIATWDGTSWAPLDIDMPGVGVYVPSIVHRSGNIYIGYGTTGTAVFPGVIDVPILGDLAQYPVISVTGPGTLRWMENIEDGKIMLFNCYLNVGEIATLDLSPGVKTFESSWRGSLFPFSSVLARSDFSSWVLENDPIAPLGVNTISAYMTDVTPAEYFDNNNQLSGWDNITGITGINTGGHGELYATIVSEGAGNYHVNLYDDITRLHLVGHTASYNSNGAKAIIADNASGLGGTVTVDARVAADADIVVYFATAKIEWRDAFLSADAAVQ